MYLTPELFNLKTDERIINIIANLYGVKATDMGLENHEPPIVKPMKSINSNILWEYDTEKPRYKAILCCSKGSLIQIVPKIHNYRKLFDKYPHDTSKFLKCGELTNFIQKYTNNDLSDINWQTITLNAGDLFIYDTALPMQTIGNKCKEPFMGLPINIVPKEWLSEKQKQIVKTQFETKQYGDWLKNYQDNREEFNWKLENNKFPKFDLTNLHNSLMSY